MKNLSLMARLVFSLLLLFCFSIILSGTPSSTALGKRPLMDVWERIEISPPLVMQLLKSADRAPASLPSTHKAVLSPGCEYPPKALQFASSNKEIESTTINLKAPAYYMRDLMAVLSLTQTGKPIAQAFLPAYESGAVEVFLATRDELMSRFHKDTIVAFCEVSIDKRKIYIDKTAETGTVAPILLHELVHCLDPEQIQHPSRFQNHLNGFNQSMNTLLNAAAKRTAKTVDKLAVTDFTPSEMTEIKNLKESISQFSHLSSFRTERKAYDAGYAVGQELLKLFPEYYQQGPPLLRGVLGTTSDEQIVERYDLNPGWIEAYKTGQCRPK